jgi:hypothetical protein
MCARIDANIVSECSPAAVNLAAVQALIAVRERPKAKMDVITHPLVIGVNP